MMIKQLKNTIDKYFLEIDKADIKRTKNIRLIPKRKNRIGGKRSYAEWCYVSGIFQTLIYQLLVNKSDNHILDVGCGNGLVGIAAEPFIGKNGMYYGIDVNENYIEFCKSHYNSSNYQFIHHDVRNRIYANKQTDQLKKWPLKSNSVDLVTALSVWTHLNEKDALYYFTEVYRVLKPGRKALITLFYLDELYYNSVTDRTNGECKYNFSMQNEWIFDKSVYDSEKWKSNSDIPEKAVGIDKQGLEMIEKHSKLKTVKIYHGNWKEIPGIYFQDIIIFEKL